MGLRNTHLPSSFPVNNLLRHDKTMATVTVTGAGVTGLWQAYILAKRGHQVRLIERSAQPFAAAASRLAGAMLAPFCELEAAEELIADLGLRSLELWRDVPGVMQPYGSLVLAQPRDRGELSRFARLTRGFQQVSAAQIGELEPALAGRYETGLFYPQEAHVEPITAMRALLRLAEEAGAETSFGEDGRAAAAAGPASSGDYVIDCRGWSARDDLEQLRGVRGEMLVIETREITLTRPVRLLHPRFPLYVVPWSGGRFMTGATMIESGEGGAVSVRSALDLLAAAYTLHPAFGEARIVQFAAGVRPAFPDNLPKIIVRGQRLHVNGVYRHGFLIAPALAEFTADYIETGKTDPALFAGG